ncbi:MULTISPECIES: hypothetical protein [Haloferax]|uniref:ATP phosphoribosyltransferase n=2 Tax=Haloferax TaxID=2251 RepID=A0A6G1Z329_9EURY|nr:MULTISPECIES: hypothetical protein [Haloferax]KAB1188348.1 hypothetical protein Hfx1149_10035 [Haloferax sp. CBA1149]MRW81037.1 hypothetical protein [Haloferax marinisediminis]
MTETVRVAVPRKGRPLEAVLERFATTDSIAEVADEITSTLRYEKSVTKGHAHPERDVYERLADYSDLSDPTSPEYTLLRDDREGMPRRIVFDSVSFEIDGVDIHLVGREEPFRALRTHEFGLGFDSADLVLEEVVTLEPDGIGSIEDVNARIDPMDTDVRVVSGLGDTVYHTLMADPEILPPGADLDRDFVADYAGDLCISPRYERLVEAVLGTRCLDDVSFAYPSEGPEEEAAIAEVGLGVYLTMTGSTAREHGLVLGEHLFPSETVLMENVAEATDAAETVKDAIESPDLETELRV